jgi:hypothetical protein
MPTKKRLDKREGYSLEEIKNKFLPNRNMQSLEQEGTPLTRDSFLDILKQVSRPDQPQRGKGKP